MSWHYLPELAAEFSEAVCSAGEPSAPWRKSPSPGKCSLGASGTVCLTCSRSGTTFGPSEAVSGVEQWISSLLDSPASPGREPALSGPERRTSAICGRTRFAFLDRYDRDLDFWKTSQLSLLTGTFAEFSETWPRAGLIVDGTCLRLPTSERRTFGKDSLYWPTPVASDSRRGYLIEVMRKEFWRQRRHPKYKRLGARVLAYELAGLEDSFQTPTLNEWAMGMPGGWTDLRPLEKPRFQLWLKPPGSN
jgi:hypothetical protein